MTLTSADGAKVAVRCTGDGSPIVLVHGAVGDWTPSPSRGTAGRAALGLGLLSQGSRPQRRRARLHLPRRGERHLGRPHRRRRPCPPFRPPQWRCLRTVGRHAGMLVAVTRALQAAAHRPPRRRLHPWPHRRDGDSARRRPSGPGVGSRSCRSPASSTRRGRPSRRWSRCGRGCGRAFASAGVPLRLWGVQIGDQGDPPGIQRA